MIKNLSQVPRRMADILFGHGEQEAPDTASDIASTGMEAWSDTDAGLGFRLSLITGLQILVSFAMQWYVVAELGAGVQTDALFAGNTIPQVVTSLGIDTLTFVLVPLLAPKSEKELRENGWQLLIGILSVFSLLAIVLHFAMPLLTPILVPGLSAQGRALATSLSRIQILSIVGSACYAVVSALYQVRHRFIWPLLTMLIATTLGIALLSWKIHIYGVVLAAWVQVLIVTLPPFMQLRVLGRFSRFRFDFSLLKQALRQMRPLVYGAMYYRTNFIVDRLLASFLAPGSIVILDLAQRVQAAIVRILNQGVVTPVIPRLAKLAEAGNWESFRALYRRKSLEMLLMNCGMVAIVVFVLVAHPKVGAMLPAMHFMGNLTPEAVNRLLAVFLYMSGVMLGGSLNHTLMNSYYAAGNTVTPTKIGVATYTLGIAMKLAGFFFLGLTGIALAISISTLVQTIFLYGYLRPHRLAPFNKQKKQALEESQKSGWQISQPTLPPVRQRAADL